MRYALEVVDGVELHSGSTPLPEGAIEPVTNWDDLVPLPYYYRKRVGDQILEKTQEEKDAYDEAHPPTIEELQEEAHLFLDSTDWYVIRLSDPSSGANVPQEIHDARSEARDLL